MCLFSAYSLFHIVLDPGILLRQMERWSGRIALVTGGSVGIGVAIVRCLASHGLRVVTCARRMDKLQVVNLNFTVNLFLAFYKQWFFKLGA